MAFRSPRRRFTPFPPEQVANLHVGPLDHTIAGQPVSLVDPEAPDLDRFPRFAAAMAHAQGATLEPGDALFIPPIWWHHVRAPDSLSVLVNYWWGHLVSLPRAGGFCENQNHPITPDVFRGPPLRKPSGRGARGTVDAGTSPA